LPCWVDGQVVAASEVSLGLPDSAFNEGRGVYTSARVHRGQVVWIARHGERLSRHAGLLGLPSLAASRVQDALAELADAAFPGRDGVVRFQASAAGRPERLRLVGTARELGVDPPRWRAVVSDLHHPGPSAYPGAKLSGAPWLGEARRRISARWDEALLFDRDGWLVEGTRSTIAVVDGDGRARLPELARGGVESLTRAVALGLELGLACAPLDRSSLRRAREVVALNAARGARPIVEIDGAPVGSGEIGPVYGRLAEALRGTGFPIP